MVGTAFALAGLGGFNAHGAGFLQAARENRYYPELVTATSGQILVLANYLKGETDLRTGLIDAQRENDALAQMKTALFGYPGVFKPAYGAMIGRWFETPAWFTDSVVDIVADRLSPAQIYAPARTDHDLQQIVDILNKGELDGHAIGVIFNAYNPVSGQGVLYGNDHARRVMGAKKGQRGNLKVDAASDLRYAREELDTTLLPITLEALKSALWLSLYGFQGLPNGLMDGAYHRSCILSELHVFPRVMVARPLANGWLGRQPSNYFDVQDWQCEMWFSVGYQAEVDAMKRINAMIDNDYVKPGAPLTRVDLIEIEPPTPAGYFNFFIERGAVFEAAYVMADEAFKALAEKDAKGRVRDKFPKPDLESAEDL